VLGRPDAAVLRRLLDRVGRRQEPAHRDRPGTLTSQGERNEMGVQAAASTEAAVRELEEQRYRAMVAADLRDLGSPARRYPHLHPLQRRHRHQGQLISPASATKVWEYKNISRENEAGDLRGNAALCLPAAHRTPGPRRPPQGRGATPLAVWAPRWARLAAARGTLFHRPEVEWRRRVAPVIPTDAAADQQGRWRRTAPTAAASS